MLIQFTSYAFIFIVLISLPIYWILNGKTKIQNIYLLVLSYLVYSFLNYWLGVIIFISTLVNYFCGILLGKFKKDNRRKLIIYSNVIFNIGYLGVFKYFDFFSQEISNFIALFGLNVNPILLNIILPIGISFYTLQLISYNVEIYKNKFSPTQDFIIFAVFVAFFPKLISGPIEKPSNIIPQFSDEKRIDSSGGIQLILIGFFLKVVIADYINHFINAFYVNPGNFSSTESIMIVWLFSIQIYADFSGYTNIARGISKLYGIDLTINFNQPYFSTNIQGFWRKWHISFSDWLRDYVYIPLGGNRKGYYRTLLNILLVMIICGLWHGVGINFILWGLLHGFFLIGHRIYSNEIQKHKFYKKLTEGAENLPRKLIIGKNIYLLFSWFLTFQLVSFAWIFFNTQDFNTSLIIITNAYSFNYELSPAILTNQYFNLLIFAIIVVFIIDFAQIKLNTHEILNNINWVITGILYAFIIIMIIIFQVNVYVPFYYEGF